MKKNDAIEFIKKCSKIEECGFFVVAITREDLATHYDNEVIEEFDKLSSKEKENVLSGIANEMEELYQEWNFSEDMPDEIDFECYI
jgi:signal recognition particle receptor subunit beta